MEAEWSKCLHFSRDVGLTSQINNSGWREEVLGTHWMMVLGWSDSEPWRWNSKSLMLSDRTGRDRENRLQLSPTPLPVTDREAGAQRGDVTSYTSKSHRKSLTQPDQDPSCSMWPCEPRASHLLMTDLLSSSSSSSWKCSIYLNWNKLWQYHKAKQNENVDLYVILQFAKQLCTQQHHQEACGCITPFLFPNDEEPGLREQQHFAQVSHSLQGADPAAVWGLAH